MSKSGVVTARLEPALVEELDKLAAQLDRSRAAVVAKAVERYVREELEFLNFVQEGIDDIEAGRPATQAEVEARFGVGRERRDAA